MKYFSKKKPNPAAPIFLRIIIALYLFLALQAKVYLPANIEMFGSSLGKMKLPMPQVMAWIATWSMLICYVLIVAGWFTRLVAIPMIIYFTVAVIWRHVIPAHTLGKAMPAIMLLCISIFFLLHGPGKPSVDEGF
jgi:putative oxidoreductase